jgi:hypothetical protein
VLLVDVPEDVAVDAAELPLLGLKVACVAHAASVLQVRPIEVRKRIFQMIFVQASSKATLTRASGSTSQPAQASDLRVRTPAADY